MALPFREGLNFYFCVCEASVDQNGECSAPRRHLGTTGYGLSITTVDTSPTGLNAWPLAANIIVLILLLFLSGLFSGLNLGLMALDKNELEVLVASGTEDEKKWAAALMPLRKRGNLLLCTVLLGNVLVNNTLAIFISALTGEGVGVIAATAGIVVFGEIVPQSLCSRRGLEIGAKTIPITRFFQIVRFYLPSPLFTPSDHYIYSRILESSLVCHV